MELSTRKREILRRVVEEFVATGQPVGSRVLVERSELDVSSSTVRSELAELETLGLLTHPHTSAGRIPTESGYRLYAESLVGTIEGRPQPFPVDLSAMRNELEEAMRRTTETLSEATHLLALVSGPSIEAAAVRHVEVLQLQPRIVHRRRDHRLRRSLEAGVRAGGAGRSRHRRVVAGLSQRDRRRTAARGKHLAPPARGSHALAPRATLPRHDPAGVRRPSRPGHAALRRWRREPAG